MNARIREFADKCRTIYHDGNGKFAEQFDEEKFAELIVADAINTVEKRFMGDLNREDMEVRRCVEALKEHFGVK
jgi:hypothetical protein